MTAMKEGNHKSLYDRIISKANIYSAIFSLESYVAERGLLDTKDLKLYHTLADKHDIPSIGRIINRCVKRLKAVLGNADTLFEARVYFKLKGIDENNEELESTPARSAGLGDSKEGDYNLKFRPMHTASLIDLICMASILNCLMFDDSDAGRSLSELAKLLPSNFYGNMPSTDMGSVYKPWQTQYRKFANDTIEHCRKYRETHEYQTEVRLDIKDFFPSVHPQKILDYITEKLSCAFSKDDTETLKTAVEKLLLIRLDERDIKGWEQKYYEGKAPKVVNGLYLTRGIAQGLPHAPFFGNICMTEVWKTLKESDCFPGDAYFYVDDAVIYMKESLSPKDFTERIDKANYKLQNVAFAKSANHPSGSSENWAFHNDLQYGVRLHSSGKSSFCPIDDTDAYLGGLAGLARESYQMAYAHKSLDEIDDTISADKLKSILKIVDGEIRRLKGETGEISPKLASRLKMLKRYRRFFLFRLKVLDVKNAGGVSEEDIKKFIERLRSSCATVEAVRNWFDKYDEEIFRSEYRMLIQLGNERHSRRLQKEIRHFEIKILAKQSLNAKDISRFLYYQKDASATVDSKDMGCDAYASITRWMRSSNRGESGLHGDNQIKALREFLGINSKNARGNNLAYDSECAKTTAQGGFDAILEYGFGGENSASRPVSQKGHGRHFIHFVAKNSSEFQRRILNAYFSSVVGVPTSDALAFVSNSGRLCYPEFRILARLRNSNFDFSRFKDFVRTYPEGDFSVRMGIDAALLDVLPTFIRLAKNPEQVDTLIVTHRIVKGLWSNGSKFLHSYTLHNEEHAVTLIKAVPHIVKTIDYLAIKAIDYYVLFLACYLHDVSMVIHPAMRLDVSSDPKTQSMVCEMLREANGILSQCGKSGKFEMKEFGQFLVGVFEAVYAHFENGIRDRHAKESASFIKREANGLLSYLGPIILRFVAKVSESHGVDTKEVYWCKSHAKDETVAIKYLMILIRLADLLDVASDRVNYDLLRQSLCHMSLKSCFHWISHLVTDEVRLSASYDVIDNSEAVTDEGLRSNDKRPKILENLSVDFFLNVKYLIANDKKVVTSKHPCGHRCKLDDEKASLRIDIRGEENADLDCAGCKTECPFLCQWMHKKHEWLFGELEELGEYLNSVNDELIKTRIWVNVHFGDKPLDADLFDRVREYLG